MMKIQNLLQKSQMVDRRLKSTSKTNFNVEDCSVSGAEGCNDVLDPTDMAIMSQLEAD